MLHDFPFFAILGVCGGLLGAFFNFVNTEVNLLRRIYLNNKWKKVLETLALTTITAIVIFYAPIVTKSHC